MSIWHNITNHEAKLSVLVATAISSGVEVRFVPEDSGNQTPGGGVLSVEFLDRTVKKKARTSISIFDVDSPLAVELRLGAALDKVLKKRGKPDVISVPDDGNEEVELPSLR